ncbi:LPS assembly protein LptD [Alphaproteobacteria bacterium]|nr:LPS assembly protein LptD [Alphaproteobacteria bacterium]
MKPLYNFIIKLKIIALLICSNFAYAEELITNNSFMTANHIEYHNEISMISAIGEVEIINGTQVLRADKIVYDSLNNSILAEGNVSLNDNKDNIFFAQNMELTGDFKKGVIKNFNSILNDGSSLSANIIIRDTINGDKLEKVIYTRCKPCEDDINEATIWQIRALKSNRNIEDGIIEYENVIFDVYDIPILYVPYISHIDPSIKKSSGLLSPKLTSNTIFGFSYSQPYYFALSKHRDITLTPTMTSNEGLILKTNYRSLRAKGSSNIETSFTRGSHVNIDGKESNKFRGHVDFKVAEKINKNWAVGLNAVRASDFSYLSRYKMGHDSDANLTQRAYLTGNDKDFYAKVEAMYFQPLNAFKSNRNIPLILPNIKMAWYKNYNNGIQRKIFLDGNLVTKADASNSQKLSLKSSWSKYNISKSGHVFKVKVSGRTDIYRNKKTDNSKIIGKKGTHEKFRAIPKFETMWSFPVISYYENTSMLIEPIVQGILAPKGGNPDSIHNLDSIDFELSDHNLFFSNRFAGIDRVEEGSKVNFGLKSTLQIDKHGELTSVLGRSWNPLNPQKEYIPGTGLSKKLSHIVGNIIYNSKKSIVLGYHFRRDALNFRSQRDTLTVAYDGKPIKANIDYTMVRDDPVPTQSMLSEQAHISLSWSITENWNTNIRQNRDLRNSNWGNAINSYGYIEYQNECIIIRLQAERKHQTLVDVPDTNEYSLSFNLVGF